MIYIFRIECSKWSLGVVLSFLLRSMYVTAIKKGFARLINLADGW